MSYASDNDLQPLTNESEVLLRQVHPMQYLADGTLSSVAFYPSELDEGLLSTRREDIGAERACLEWLEDHDSAGTWGVSVGEFMSETIPTADDSSLPGQPEGHTSADYTHLSDPLKKKKGRKIRDLAWSRGPLYQNEAASSAADDEDTGAL